jgi:hypothetical protein
MMTMNRRSDKLGRSTHPGGGLHDLSGERTDDRASTQADLPQPVPPIWCRPWRWVLAWPRCPHGGGAPIPKTAPVAPNISPKLCHPKPHPRWGGWPRGRPSTHNSVARPSLGSWSGCSCLGSGCCGRTRFVRRGASAPVPQGSSISTPLPCRAWGDHGRICLWRSIGPRT